MPKVLLFPNMDKIGVPETLDKAVQFLRSQNREIMLPPSLAALYSAHSFDQNWTEHAKDIEFALALGGDGTLLRLVKDLAPYNIPLCGINLGKLGFLAELDADGFIDKLSLILSKKYTLEKRSMLKAVLIQNDKNIATEHALNDIVITGINATQMIHLYANFSSGGQIKYPVDGLIFATPTGSTAYSLSAGGSIVDPTLDAFLLTPICAHALYTRPLIVKLSEVVTVRQAFEDKDVSLVSDGQVFARMKKGDELRISRSEYTASFIRLAVPDFYVTWQEKLRRGEESAKF